MGHLQKLWPICAMAASVVAILAQEAAAQTIEMKGAPVAHSPNPAARAPMPAASSAGQCHMVQVCGSPPPPPPPPPPPRHRARLIVCPHRAHKVRVHAYVRPRPIRPVYRQVAIVPPPCPERVWVAPQPADYSSAVQNGTLVWASRTY